jgi:hypothetical protein
MILSAVDVFQFKAMVILICLIIFIRHIEPMRELFRKETDEDTNGDD